MAVVVVVVFFFFVSLDYILTIAGRAFNATGAPYMRKCLLMCDVMCVRDHMDKLMSTDQPASIVASREKERYIERLCNISPFCDSPIKS